jgi:hypothetical protein
MGQSATELRYEIAQTRQQMGETMDAIGDHVSPGRMMERRKNRMARGFQSVRDRVMGSASSTGHSMSSSAHGAMESIEHSPEMVRERTAGSPLVAGAVAFGIGALVAAAIPPSRKEQEHAGELAERLQPVKDELMGAARGVAEDLREPAKEAVDEVKGAASSAAEDVKGTAKGNAEAVTGSSTGRTAGSGTTGTGTTGTGSSGTRTPSASQARRNRETDLPG